MNREILQRKSRLTPALLHRYVQLISHALLRLRAALRVEDVVVVEPLARVVRCVCILVAHVGGCVRLGVRRETGRVVWMKSVISEIDAGVENFKGD